MERPTPPRPPARLTAPGAPAHAAAPGLAVGPVAEVGVGPVGLGVEPRPVPAPVQVLSHEGVARREPGPPAPVGLVRVPVPLVDPPVGRPPLPRPMPRPLGKGSESESESENESEGESEGEGESESAKV